MHYLLLKTPIWGKLGAKLKLCAPIISQLSLTLVIYSFMYYFRFVLLLLLLADLYRTEKNGLKYGTVPDKYTFEQTL